MKKFFDVVFANVSDNYYINIWTLPQKTSAWYKPSDIPTDWPQDRDVYYGMGLASKPYGPKSRLKVADVAGITCLWADIDYGPNHAKKVPPDEATAGELIRSCGLHPSLVVHSGNGWHTMWLLNQPWIFDTPAERTVAGNLVKAWQDWIRSIFQDAGYALDATHDLSRILRVPGTINHKNPNNLKKVEICWGDLNNVVRYSTGDFQRLVGIKNTVAPPPPRQTSPALILHRDAIAPQNKFNALLANSEVFQNTWLSKRPDLTDPSPSGYDLAMANVTAAAGWADQEIANTIIHWRRKYGHDVNKALRRDYMTMTIAKARLSSSIDDGADTIEPIEEITEEKRIDYLAIMAERLRFPIARVIKQGIENSMYSIVLPDNREVYIGNSETLLNIRQFRGRVFDSTGIAIPSHKNEVWFRTCEILVRLAELVEDEDAVEAAQVEEWLGRFLEDRNFRPDTEDEWVERHGLCQPFALDGQLHLHAGTFWHYIKTVIGWRSYPLCDVRRNLRKLGFKSSKLSPTSEQTGKRYRRHVWKRSLEKEAPIT